MVRVGLEWDLPWKEQKNIKLARMYNSVRLLYLTLYITSHLFSQVEEAFPSLRRFRNQWAVAYLAREAFVGHKSYGICKKRPCSYRGKLDRLRRNKQPHESEDDNESSSHDSFSLDDNEKDLAPLPLEQVHADSPLPDLTDMEDEE